MTKCPACQQDNPDSARFCNNCGTSLTVLAATAAPKAYTPPHLADKILTLRAAMIGERKQVTVLFADLKGSMELLADRDPEEARRVLDPVLERMMEAVHRYEGTVNQVLGDGIMALFGAPLAHEDHAVRACYAALRMQETVGRYAEQIQKTEGISVRIRVGLNSGEVVVRSIENDLKMDYSAVGQTTHLAARMEQMAAPGTILVAPSTLRLAEGAVQVTPLGPRPVKGLDAPVEVSELVGGAPARSTLRSADARELARFIGRAAELERLHALLELARTGHGQVVAVSSEAGVGKTRLVHEFLRSAKTQTWRILEGRSHSYERAASYRPVIEILRAYFELDALDPASRVTEKVAATIRDLDPALGEAVPPILSLLDALPADDPFRTLDARERHDRVVDALTHVLLKEAERQPLVLVLENLQWVDGETQAFLDRLLDRIPTTRLLLLVDFRPEYEHDWAGRPGFTHLAIDPLSAAATGELLGELLGDHPSLRPARELLIQRSGGNPFFLEEIVRTLVETKVLVGERRAYRLGRELQSPQVPATVQAVLAARIDRLPSDEKLLLQSAAVVGSEVPQALLEAIVDGPAERVARALVSLQGAGFLYEASLFPDVVYRFRSSLTRDVAYASLLREQRRVLHARIVDAIERLYHDRRTSHVDQLAFHASRGEVWAKALVYNRQVGARAVLHAANGEAVQAFQDALAALKRLPETRETLEQAIDLRLDLRPPLLQLGRLDDVLTVSREAERLAGELRDEPRLARVYTYLINYHYLKGETTQAIEYGQRCLEVGRAIGDPALEGLARQYMGQSYHAQGDYAQAERALRENIVATAGDQATISYVASCGWLAFSLADRGAFDAANSYLAEAQRAAETTQHAYSRLIAWTLIGLVWIRRGRLARAVLPLERGLEACRKKHLTVWLPIPLSLLGLGFVRMGHVHEGLRLLEDGVALSRELGIRAYLAAWLVNLAEGLLADAQYQRAHETARQALDMAREHGERGHEAQALHVLGDIAARGVPPDPVEARARYEDALRLAGELGLRPLVATCLMSLGALDARLGDGTSAARRRAQAQQTFEELNMRSGREQAERELTELGHLFIVARSQPDLYDFLAQELSGAERIRVLLDRRRGEQRQRFEELTEERRRAERRREQLDQDLRDWGFGVAPRRPG
jgi:class 3 adenylate cyclase/tetratricopeptide (TPR) repeat protein